MNETAIKSRETTIASVIQNIKAMVHTWTGGGLLKWFKTSL